MSEDSELILAELRSVRRVGQSILGVLLLLLIVAIISFPARRPRAVSRVASWDSVRTSMNQQDFHKALAEAQELVALHPGYYYGQAYLGLVYLSIGDLTNAEVHYARAHELFPNEQSEKDLAAVRKRLEQNQPVKLLSQ